MRRWKMLSKYFFIILLLKTISVKVKEKCSRCGNAKFPLMVTGESWKHITEDICQIHFKDVPNGSIGMELLFNIDSIPWIIIAWTTVHNSNYFLTFQECFENQQFVSLSQNSNRVDNSSSVGQAMRTQVWQNHPPPPPPQAFWSLERNITQMFPRDLSSGRLNLNDIEYGGGGGYITQNLNPPAILFWTAFLPLFLTFSVLLIYKHPHVFSAKSALCYLDLQ